MIGMELGVSVASALLRGEATGAPNNFVGDVVCTAKKDLQPGDTLDGEGGYAVRGSLATATQSLKLGALPLGLAHGARVRRPVAANAIVGWDDVGLDDNPAVRLRWELEDKYRNSTAGPSTPPRLQDEANMNRANRNQTLRKLNLKNGSPT